jgi:hypothetical protein
MSFFKDIEAIFKKVFGSTNWEQTAETTITVAAPMLETIVALAAGGPAAAAVTGVVKQVQNDLAATTMLLRSASGPTVKQKISNLITGINANLQTLLADADVKNSAKAAEITAAVNGISGELQAILQFA